MRITFPRIHPLSAAPQDPFSDVDLSLPDELQPTGDPVIDGINLEVIKRFRGLGATAKLASPKALRYLLDRENEEVCLRCGEVNPGTRKKGYSDGHVCHMDRFVNFPEKSPDRVSEEHEYRPEGTPIGEVKTKR